MKKLSDFNDCLQSLKMNHTPEFDYKSFKYLILMTAASLRINTDEVERKRAKEIVAIFKPT